jgi:hypothetical protein
MPPPHLNRKRKGPPIEAELFGQAEAYLQTEFVPLEEAELLAEYRAAVADQLAHYTSAGTAAAPRTARGRPSRGRLALRLSP